MTHNVITSGLLPKHMGWTDDGYRDVDGVLAGQGDDETNLWVTSDWSRDQMFAVQNHVGYPKLPTTSATSRTPVKVFTISPKTYAAWAFGGDGSDSIITFGGSTTCPNLSGSFRAPGGVNVPSYIATPCGRYYVHTGSSLRYDTLENPASLYPLDGDRYTTGKDPTRLGGDVWATDAAIDVMRNEDDWRGIFVTLPGVDKAAHMWGGVDDDGPTPVTGDAMTHMDFATQTADDQVGKILDELESTDELDNTLVVLTADHGSVVGRAVLRHLRPGAELRLQQLVLRQRRAARRHVPDAPGRPEAAGRDRKPGLLVQRLDGPRVAHRPVRGQGRRGGRDHGRDASGLGGVASQRRPLRPGLPDPLGPDDQRGREVVVRAGRRRSSSTPRAPTTGRT